MPLPTIFRHKLGKLLLITIFLIAFYDFHYSNLLLSVDTINRFRFKISWVSQTNRNPETNDGNRIQISYGNKSNSQRNGNLANNSTFNGSSNPMIQISAAVADKALLINTRGCALPQTEFYPNGFTMKKDYGPNCDFVKRIVTIDDSSEMLRLSAEGENELKKNKTACSVFQVNRFSQRDSFLTGETRFNLTTTEPLDISDKELFETKCGQFTNFDAHFPLNETVRDKISFWKKHETADQTKPLPISVLLIGFDSVSRSHFHRSLKKTLPILTQMGFIDFKGYHTIAPNTLDNFYAFLMGLTNPQVRRSCSAYWGTPFDTCPTIWKDFALNNYVTIYAEDGSQSFNAGGQGGFQTKPTDYYTHTLFAAVQALRMKYFNQTKEDSCPSSINNQNFLLEYTKRFIKKFMTTPFFSLTFFAFPFHDNTFSLYGLDEKLEEFFQFINSDEAKPLRERTLIVFNSDHGERHEDFIKWAAYEGRIETSLPGMFIRLPDNLLKEYPESNLVHTLNLNSERLTSGFDLHHTFLHLLKLRDLEIIEQNQNRSIGMDSEFEPVLSDRSSLLLPVSDQRTCADLNINNETCVCTKVENQSSSNTSSQFKYNNALYFSLLVKFAVFELNSIVNGSKYGDVCEAHKVTVMSFVSWNVKEDVDEATHGFLRFVTYTQFSKALFEVLLRVPHTKAVVDMEGIKRIGSFNRLNRYGDLSWCVDLETDFDKNMKALCHCKKRKGDAVLLIP